ncbi:Ig-like domain-containing protein [Paenibacillus eucommiae]|uniref:Uncharacterized protein YjdB n=1 Tax=Paenibacillus eucommiae TaxID=1355755 RepID=A0ABS4J3X6_9BACL|nr:Ig-like domain-containing protein [Paenibacillus eucommiae]MBP1994542.1 uncharacterized protein YjdB [Paenibacillus eucommiae]
MKKRYKLLAFFTLLLSLSLVLAALSTQALAGDTQHVSTTASITTGKISDEKYPIGIYWPPTPEYTTPAQYDLIKEAGINTIEVPNIPGYLAVRNDAILDYAAARGMKAFVPPSEAMGANAMALTDDQLQAYVNQYKDHPGLGGYFIMDEPGPAVMSEAARIYKKIAELDPNHHPHVNMLPFTNLFQQWVDLVGADKLNYLATDFYPYIVKPGGGTAIKPDFYSFLDELRKTGLKNNVKTSNYLQSVGIDGYLVRPDANRMRHDVYSNLSYGVKGLTWFTWWSPGNTGVEKFSDEAIVTKNGMKSDLYEPVKELNRQITTLGPTLLRLNAVEVYHAGQMPDGTVKVPADYFFKLIPDDKGKETQTIISHMVDAESGRNYIMAVNRTLAQTYDLSFKLDPSWKIKEVTEVSKKTGKEIPTDYNPTTGVLKGNFLPGEGKLYALDPDFTYQASKAVGNDTPGNPSTEPVYGPYTNLALQKHVTATSSYDTGGWGLWQIVDGVNMDGLSHGSNFGWSSLGDIYRNHTDSVTIDLGGLYPVDQVKLFPTMGAGYFPKQYNIQVSEDLINWQTVITSSEQPFDNDQLIKDAVVHGFTPTSARYVKTEVTDMVQAAEVHAQFAEIEIYARTISPLSVSSDSKILIAHKPAPLTVKKWNAAGELVNVAGENVTFVSKNEAVATVDAGGVVTGLTSGQTQITVTVTDGVYGPSESIDYGIEVIAFPQPWDASFIGSASGRLLSSPPDTFTINSTGKGLGKGYAYIKQPLDISEPLVLTTTLNQLYQTNEAGGMDGRAGLLISSDNPAENVFLSANASGRLTLVTGSQVVLGDYVNFPAELALIKDGNSYSGYYKKAGKWVPFNNTQAQSTSSGNMGGALTWGVATFSNSDTLHNQAQFSGTKSYPGMSADIRALLSYPKMPIDAQQQIVILGTTKEGFPAAVPANYEMAYKSSNSDIATVDENGTIQAIKAGTIQITVTVSDSGNVRAVLTVDLEVQPATWTDEIEEVDHGSPFEVRDAVFKDFEGNVIDRLIGRDFVKAYATLHNKSDQAQTATIITALYDSKGAMVNLSYLEHTVQGGGTDYLNAGFRLPEETKGFVLKMFVWDTLNQMTPWSNEVSLKNEVE